VTFTEALDFGRMAKVSAYHLEGLAAAKPDSDVPYYAASRVAREVADEWFARALWIRATAAVEVA
jgi:hypothetical protein